MGQLSILSNKKLRLLCIIALLLMLALLVSVMIITYKSEFSDLKKRHIYISNISFEQSDHNPYAYLNIIVKSECDIEYAEIIFNDFLENYSYFLDNLRKSNEGISQTPFFIVNFRYNPDTLLCKFVGDMWTNFEKWEKFTGSIYE